eukprot:TRINITY_DN5030_c0_g1_i3.p1 TRINITY_DN5030_c0_g1~~TRINITY_DN5030_c0_g1_i3.p1  ORF type:complete len:526 (-),score=113.14 TRINITY_DN5030_c0_g1_i3:54-1580(-)
MSNPKDKSEHMKHKTDEARRLFNLPDTESVIQDYSCSLDKLTPGRLYISQNYLCFASTLSHSLESIPFRKVTDITPDSTLFFQNAIAVTFQGGFHSFGGLVHRDETLNLMLHLWKHPPSYVDLEDVVEVPSNAAEREKAAAAGSSSSPKSQDTKDQPARSSTGSSSSSSSSSSLGGSTYGSSRGSSGSYGSTDGVQEQTSTVKVDTTSTRNALRLAYEAREIGTATMSELSYQAEVIDLIERDVERVHANLDKSDRLLRGIESVGGGLKNALSSEKKGKDMQYIDRTLVVTKEDVPVDVDILWKQPNDMLVPALMRLYKDKFVCVNAASKQPEKDMTFPFDQIESVVLRARHQHIDIRFLGKAPRFRLMSSYVQPIVNELALRIKDLKVVFEPGTRQFPYGSNNIQLPTSGGAAATRKAGFFRSSAATTTISPVITGLNVDSETKTALIQQEKDLDEISSVLGDIYAIGTTMGVEIDRSSEQLDRITNRVDSANVRLAKTNQRIDRML